MSRDCRATCVRALLQAYGPVPLDNFWYWSWRLSVNVWRPRWTRRLHRILRFPVCCSEQGKVCTGVHWLASCRPDWVPRRLLGAAPLTWRTQVTPPLLDAQSTEAATGYNPQRRARSAQRVCQRPASCRGTNCHLHVARADPAVFQWYRSLRQAWTHKHVAPPFLRHCCMFHSGLQTIVALLIAGYKFCLFKYAL